MQGAGENQRDETGRDGPRGEASEHRDQVERRRRRHVDQISTTVGLEGHHPGITETAHPHEEVTRVREPAEEGTPGRGLEHEVSGLGGDRLQDGGARRDEGCLL
jgi:hypothetical protein